MASATHLLAYQDPPPRAWLEYRYDETDDLIAVQRWLWKGLGRDAGPYVYIEPLEGTFERKAGLGAVTVLALPVTIPEGRATTPFYKEQMQLVISAYGSAPAGEPGRAETVALGRRIWRLFNEGQPGAPPWRIPMYADAYRAQLARFLRVLPRSLSMGLEDTTDQGLWRRPIEVTVEAPRQRDVRFTPTVEAIGTRL